MGEARTSLDQFEPAHAFFVGIDSDGCVFDTMEIKHKECFIPQIISRWGLQSVSKYAREVAEFVNLYSRDRGVNRWPALIRTFDLLRDRAEVKARGAAVPEAGPVREFIASGVPLDNRNVKLLAEKTGDPILRQALEWSEAVNLAIAEMVHDVPPFPHVRASLERLFETADLVVVSQTPTEALCREWEEHGIDRYAKLICGQELGTKAEHLQRATRGRYAPGRVLMIGDALGDLKAARAAGALFFPVNPGGEEESWRRFREEGIDRFLGGEYTAAYEQRLIAEFEACLPTTPPWK